VFSDTGQVFNADDGVTWPYPYVSDDKTTWLCLYDARPLLHPKMRQSPHAAGSPAS